MNQPLDIVVAPCVDDVPTGVRKKILCVEDNLSNIRLIESILESRPNVELIIAISGGLAMDLTRYHQPDLILLDLNLPEVSGQTLLASLKADPDTAAIPVLVVTADASEGQEGRLRTAGAESYMTKPLDVRTFLVTVDKLLEPGLDLPKETRAA